MIHCIGDSHSCFFSGQEEMQPFWPEPSNDKLPYFKSYRIGAATAYNLFHKIPIIDEIVKLKVDKDKDIVIFCFGEVDIRAHLLKQKEIQNKEINILIKECVDRYWFVVLYFHSLGYKMGVWAPIASWGDDKPYSGQSFGTNVERNLVTNIFTDYLNDLASNSDIEIISIFNKMLNDDSSTNASYLDEWEGCHIHLNQKAMPMAIEEFKRKQIII